MIKKLQCLVVGLILINIPLFAQSRKKSTHDDIQHTSASAPAHIKASLQAYNHVAYNLSDDELKNLPSQVDNGNGEACWKLAKYFYCTGQKDKYITYIKKGCELSDVDCLYEIISNDKKEIPCTKEEHKKYDDKLKFLGRNGNKKANLYLGILHPVFAD